MNQNLITLSCVFLAAALSTIGSNWQSNKARDKAESTALATLSTEFAGVKSSVDRVSILLFTITNEQSVLKTEVKSLQEFRIDASARLRALEIKVR